MTDLWLLGYTVVKGNPAGPYTGGNHKGLLHTTEGDTAASAIGAFRANNSWSHILLSFEKGHVDRYQHIPLNLAARSLKHLAGTGATNTDCVVQIELVGRAIQTPSWHHDYLDGIAATMRDVERAFGVDRLCGVTFKGYPASAGVDNGVRLDWQHWHNYGGWLGHQHCPSNDHGDPGAIDIAYLMQHKEWHVYNPPLPPTVATLACPTGGVWLLAAQGQVAAIEGAPFHGAAYGQPYFAGRTADHLEPKGDGYTIVATSGERYDYP